MIRKLREDWVAKQLAAPSGGMTASVRAGNPQSLWREFHDQFLSHGGPPIPMLRKQMLGDDSPAL
jgi:hypothetical protein